MKTYSASETKALLPWASLVDVLEQTVLEYASGRIHCPERMVLPGKDAGLLMCMPTIASDVMVTKLLTIFPENGARDLPAIQGRVLCADGQDGRFLFSLDGPVVTMCRTAAMTMLGVRHLFSGAPVRVLLVGTGVQAQAHVEAFRALYPDVEIMVRGRTVESAVRFCERYEEDGRVVPDPGGVERFDVVVTLTASQQVIYDAVPRADCLVVGVGAYRPDMIEVGPQIVRNSVVYVDDPIGAPTEAGDILQAGVSWDLVRPLAGVLEGGAEAGRPVFFKSVGCGAWDLAACRLVRAMM